MKRKYIIALILILAGLYSFYIRPDEIFSRTGMAMNTVIRLSIKAHDDDSLEDAFDLLRSLDESLSMYDPSSDVACINDYAGICTVYVPPYVVDVVRKAVHLHDITDGIFNPLIGAVTRLWKINRADGSIPSTESLDEAVKLTDISKMVIQRNNIFLKEKGCVLDLGGIAKGFAGDKIAGLFRKNGITSALIDLGGNICVVGKNFDGELWKIGIRDPFEPFSAPALVVSVHDCSVITSGNYERFKIVDGKKYSHFFDPKTGNSIINDLLSVTVIHEDGALADGLATAFMTAGFDKACKMSKTLGVKTVLIRNDRIIFASDSLKDIISQNKFQVMFF